MTPRERFTTALALGIPDKVPIVDYIDEKVILGMANLLGLNAAEQATATRKGEESKSYLDTYSNVIEALDHDATWLSYSTGLTRVRDDWGVDKYDRGFLLSEHGIPAIMEGGVKSLKDLETYRMADRVSWEDFERAAYVIEKVGNDRSHIMSMNGPFQEGWLVRGGMDKLMTDYMTNPELAHAVSREVVEFNKRIIDYAQEIGVDVVSFDGDMAGNVTTLMSLEHFHEFILPYKQEMCNYVHEKGMQVFKHCDGVVWPILDVFVESGFDGFHPVQPQCMDIGATKQYLKGKMCVFGNIDCLDLLVFGTPDEVEEAVYNTIQIAAPEGGYVLCSSNSLHPGCTPENSLRMFEAARKYGNYANIPDKMSPQPDPPKVPGQGEQRRVNRRRKKKSLAVAV
ncbi:MAG: uroporphyrinogen decarboxylase family protein [Chloroflexota bacterium]